MLLLYSNSFTVKITFTLSKATYLSVVFNSLLKSIVHLYSFGKENQYNDDPGLFNTIIAFVISTDLAVQILRLRPA